MALNTLMFKVFIYYIGLLLFKGWTYDIFKTCYSWTFRYYTSDLKRVTAGRLGTTLQIYSVQLCRMKTVNLKCLVFKCPVVTLVKQCHTFRSVLYLISWKETKRFDNSIMLIGVNGSKDQYFILLPGHIQYRKHRGHKKVCTGVKFKSCYHVVKNHIKRFLLLYRFRKKYSLMTYLRCTVS